jgi:3-isopropylmalate/(R)-2-methylmalate dehydratase small subunit
MIDNIDTDQIIPSREMKTVGRDGLAEGLFAGWRYLEPGTRVANPDFILNQIDSPAASILVSGENLGCGSSREHAVWALAEYGIRVLIAKSFGEIFHGNCIRNGLLPITLAAHEIDQLAALGPTLDIAVNLESQEVRCNQSPNWVGQFEIGAYPKRLLLEGLDPIGLTQTQGDEITSFFERDRRARPWIYAAGEY